jgi:hypothetical protein
MFSSKRTVSETREGPSLLGIERRAAIRYASEQGASCALGHKAARAWGRLRDISALGAGLLLARQINPGTRLVIEMARKKPTTPLRVLARVVHCQQQSDTTWIIGCQFDTPLQDEVVQELA